MTGRECENERCFPFPTRFLELRSGGHLMFMLICWAGNESAAGIGTSQIERVAA